MNNDDIDNLIATRIMGWVVHPRNTIHWMRSSDSQIGYKIMGSTCCSDKFQPSRKLSDAWRVVEHITQPCVGRVDGMPWSTRFSHLWRQADLWACSAEEAAMDICLLAIRAAGIEESNASNNRAGEAGSGSSPC
jgi:hypothetical protein